MTMLPLGTRVTIQSVDHLAKPHRLKHLIGRTAVVGDHENGMNILTGTGWVITGYYAFPDHALTITGRDSAPAMPRRYRVHGYWTPDPKEN
jgi:hypothetical protein